MHPSFILKKAKNDQYYFVLTAKNGQVIAQSEMYTYRDAAENGINSVKENAPDAVIDDQTEENAPVKKIEKRKFVEGLEQYIDKCLANNKYGSPIHKMAWLAKVGMNKTFNGKDIYELAGTANDYGKDD